MWSASAASADKLISEKLTSDMSAPDDAVTRQEQDGFRLVGYGSLLSGDVITCSGRAFHCEREWDQRHIGLITVSRFRFHRTQHCAACKCHHIGQGDARLLAARIMCPTVVICSLITRHIFC